MRYLKETFHTWWRENTNHNTLLENTHGENLPVPIEDTFDVTYHAKQIAKGFFILGAGVLSYVGLSTFFRSASKEKTSETDLVAETNTVSLLSFPEDFFFDLSAELKSSETLSSVKTFVPEEAILTSFSTSRSLLSLEEKEEVQDNGEIFPRYIDPTITNPNDPDNDLDSSSVSPLATVTGYQASSALWLMESSIFFSMAPLPFGGFVMLEDEYLSENESTIYGQLFNTTAQPTGDKFWVGNTVGFPFFTFFSVANLTNGDFVATWLGSQEGESVSYGIYGKRYSGTGKLKSKFLVVNSTNSCSPSVTGLSDGSFILSWGCCATYASYSKLTYYKRHYNAMGQPLEPATYVATATSSTTTLGSPTILAIPSSNNGYILIWNGEGKDKDYGIYGQRYDSSGKIVNSVYAITTDPSFIEVASSATTLSNENFMVVWNGIDPFSQVFGQLCSLNGTIGNWLTISNEEWLSTCSTTNKEIASLQNGGFIVVWGSGYAYDVEKLQPVARYYDTTMTAGSIFQLEGDILGSVGVTSLSDGKFVVAWLTIPGVRGCLFYPNQTLSLLKNSMEISQDETVTITPNMLWAQASLNSDALKFSINITHGKFIRGSDPTLITEFYRNEIEEGKIRFVASDKKPSYSVSATDGMMLTTPFSQAEITFFPNNPSSLGWLIPVLIVGGIVGACCICIAPLGICFITATGIYVLRTKQRNQKLQRRLKYEDLEASNNNPLKLSAFLQEFTVDWEDIRLLEKIGHGGQAIVYKAQWENKDVAFKITHIDIFSVMSHFEKEAEIMLKLNHPNVVQLHKIAVRPNKFALVMELMELGSLQSAIENKNIILSWESKWQISYDLATVIEYCHKKNILHRDIKPGNLLLFLKKDVIHAKVGDFGLSRIREHAEDSLTKGGQGTYRYMAPEILTGDYSESIDIYGIGMICVVLITESKAYPDRKNSVSIPLEVSEKKLKPILPKGAGSPCLFRLTERCVNSIAEERPTAKEVVQELEQMRKEVIDFGESIIFAEEEAFDEEPSQSLTQESSSINQI